MITINGSSISQAQAPDTITSKFVAAAHSQPSVKASPSPKDLGPDEDDEENRDAELRKFESGSPPQDPKRYSRAEITAQIPPHGKDHGPLELEYLIPVVEPGDIGLDAPFVVTVHAGRGRPDRLSVWKKLAEKDLFERLFTELAEGDSRFDLPQIFSANVLVRGRGPDRNESGTFLNLPLYRYWGDGAGVTDTLFAIDSVDGDVVLRPVNIEPIDEAKVARPDEWDWNSFNNSFGNDRLEFSFHLWEKKQCHACPGGADVTGTYKLIDEEHYDDDKEAWVANWKMTMDTIQRGPTTPVSR